MKPDYNAVAIKALADALRDWESFDNQRMGRMKPLSHFQVKRSSEALTEHTKKLEEALAKTTEALKCIEGWDYYPATNIAEEALAEINCLLAKDE